MSADNRFVELPDDEESLDFGRYVKVVFRNKWNIIALTIVVTALAVVYVNNIEPVYRSTATLLLENQQRKLVSIDELYGLNSGEGSYYQTQVALLRSRQMSIEVIEHGGIDFAKEPSFNPNLVEQKVPFWQELIPLLRKEKGTLSDEQLKSRMISVMRSGLSIGTVSGTSLINISFDSTDSQLAARVANLVCEVYIESQLEARMELTEKATSWLTERLEELRLKLRDSENALQAFQERERLVESTGGSVRGLALSEINSTSTSLIKARNDREEAERNYLQVARLQATNVDQLRFVPAIQSQSQVFAARQTIDQTERKVLELSERYGPKHPKMINAVAERDSAERRMNDLVTNAVNKLKEAYETALANEQVLERNEERSRQEFQDLRKKEFQLAELQRSVETDRQLYETFFTRFRETNATEGLQAANARIADHAIPGGKIRPNMQNTLTMVIALTIMAGVGLALLRDFLDNTLKDGKDVEEKLGQPMLGVVPYVKSRHMTEERCSQLFLEKEFATFAESIRTIRTSVLLSALDNPHKIVVITSSVPGEGKTTVSYNLAIALGQMEKVLLIDADMRRPSVGGDSGLPNHAPGLSNFVAGSNSLDECVYAMDDYGIDIMPAGMIPPNPLELLSSRQFANTLGELEQSYDRIVIDSAPSQAVSDAQVLSSLASALIYVVRADSTSKQVASASLKRLQRVDAHIIGVVLNHFNVEDAARYGYYSGGYYDYYGYSQKNSESEVRSAA